MKQAYNNISGSSMAGYRVIFDRKVREVYVSGWGQGWGNETIFYLMADGTIEYTPLSSKVIDSIADSIDSYTCKSYGKIPDVEEVVVVASADKSPTNSEYGGGMAIIGVKPNGEFYDLSKILEDTESYKYN